MKTAAISGAIACLALAGSAAAQAGRDAAPDYVATMQALDRDGRPADPAVTVVHHDGMFLTETRLRDGQASIGFGPDRNAPVLRWSRQPDGEVTLMELLMPARKPDAADRTRPLDASSIVAGQTCRWRETADALRPREQSCVTGDGIVAETKLLSEKDQALYHSRLASLERRAVRLEDMRPPPEILTAEFWLRPASIHAADPSRPDYEITLEGAGQSSLRLLRHYPWSYREQRDTDGAVTVRIWNEREDRGILYRQGRDDRHLRASRRAPSSSDLDATTGRVPLGKGDTVLGETCEWFDPAPAGHDGASRQCLTKDGLPLKEDAAGRTADRSYTATSLRRRPVDPQEMRLPPEAFSPAAWGLP
ncbi:hypothetical protein [Rhizobium sp. KDH_Rht_773_N]